ncbi:MAG: hypothetical protein KAS38_10020, partial [Anaerolineales bacterium]|nr:hypothetical protein [Anaerolineales bacterium]
MKGKIYHIIAILIVTALLLVACQPTTPAVEEPVAEEPVAEEVETEEPVAEEPSEEGPCLIIGALHGGPITDAGYNQAMHES